MDWRSVNQPIYTGLALETTTVWQRIWHATDLNLNHCKQVIIDCVESFVSGCQQRLCITIDTIQDLVGAKWGVGAKVSELRKLPTDFSNISQAKQAPSWGGGGWGGKTHLRAQNSLGSNVQICILQLSASKIYKNSTLYFNNEYKILYGYYTLHEKLMLFD